MNFGLRIQQGCLVLTVATMLGAPTGMAVAQNSMNVLGGTLSWATSTSTQPCGGVNSGSFQIMEYTTFQWQYGRTVYPVSGSAAYIYMSAPVQKSP